MFRSFFPRPGLLFGSFAVWALACILFWFIYGEPVGELLSIGHWLGLVRLDYDLLHALKEEAVRFTQKTDPAHVTLVKEQIAALERAATFWLYEFMLFCYIAFLGPWSYFGRSHRWLRWSLFGTATIIFVSWIMVEIDVMINDWFGEFYDMVEYAFKDPGSISEKAYYEKLATFFIIAGIYVPIATLNIYFVQHYNFRWRTAMTDYYSGMWDRVRYIEGASQRIQEDTMRFASVLESLGAGFLDAVMTLIAFTPILIGLSLHIVRIPIFGEISHGLFVVAITWAAFGTLLLFLVGYYLPSLEFRNQRVEAAYRKELVLGEGDAMRAEPMKLRELFGDVRKNYFRLYFHYMYFNVVRYSYIQASVLVPYVAIAPTIVSREAVLAGFTLGVMQQMIRTFGRIQDSVQYLVRSWPTIVELLSIYKRLKAFELAARNLPLQKIDLEINKE